MDMCTCRYDDSGLESGNYDSKVEKRVLFMTGAVAEGDQVIQKRRKVDKETGTVTAKPVTKSANEDHVVAALRNKTVRQELRAQRDRGTPGTAAKRAKAEATEAASHERRMDMYDDVRTKVERVDAALKAARGR